MMTMSPASDQLDRAITDLYRTFAYYTAENLAGCPHCVSETESRQLAEASLKSLSPHDLEDYGLSAMTTWGDVADFKHFLPRLFEILARDADHFATDAEIVLAKLNYAGWRTWPPAEQSAVEQFLHALWLDLLSRHPHVLDADECICAIAGAERDMSFYLGALSAAETFSAMLHLADFVLSNARGLAGSKAGVRLSNAFWSDRPDQARQVWDWLRAPNRADQLERAFFAFAHDDKDGILSEAFTHLDALRQRADETVR